MFRPGGGTSVPGMLPLVPPHEEAGIRGSKPGAHGRSSLLVIPASIMQEVVPSKNEIHHLKNHLILFIMISPLSVQAVTASHQSKFMLNTRVKTGYIERHKVQLFRPDEASEFRQNILTVLDI